MQIGTLGASLTCAKYKQASYLYILYYYHRANKLVLTDWLSARIVPSVVSSCGDGFVIVNLVSQLYTMFFTL